MSTILLYNWFGKIINLLYYLLFKPLACSVVGSSPMLSEYYFCDGNGANIDQI